MFVGPRCRCCVISLSMLAALSRIACATEFHLDSWSGAIFSSACSWVMRCSMPFSSLGFVAVGLAGAACVGAGVARVCAWARASGVQTSAVIASERAKETETDMAKAFLRRHGCLEYAANG